MPEKVSFKELLHMRRNYIGKSCKIHYEVAPLKIVRASKQYMYDEGGNEYLDCINNIAHVGHCHPHVVHSGQQQMAQLSTCQGFITDQLSLYAKKLVETLPERLSVCYFVNSGSEANDLAMRLAQSYTKNEDMIVLEGAFHGNIGSVLDISPLSLKRLRQPTKDFVHIVPSPDCYRGMYREPEEELGQKYANEVLKVLQSMHEKGRNVAAFVSEPVMSKSGVVIPPKDYLKTVYSYIRDSGGLCIADEVSVGLGRTGEYWSFQHFDVCPDIVTCGKPLGNGYPMAVVITTREIADSLGEFSSGCGGNPISCAIGLAVMEVIQNEKMLSSATFVGKALVEGFKKIQPQHPMLGDVRGMGLVVGLDIVADKESKKPSKEVAELLCYKMKQERILVINEGPHKNVLELSPPLCFTCNDAARLIQVFDKVLREIECGACPERVREATGSPATVQTTELFIPADIITNGNSSESSSDEDDNDLNEDGQPQKKKRRRFEDID